ncbi:OsmC family protein [Aliifodinibius sp. S!AR15-10]|uniref:OsmC family protein n=1 Tax=Aliifodinibius sp. S!AR15-10 TaxID=2950437 RepID=UPI0028631C5D|nr:OsmC family protein [Aliifodinibius sp. S!AR15-10]MDR8393284.1 OsmC family protein [Aliifodinibius sp. S!AR15-10]
MPKRKAEAIWNGDLKGGKGTMKFGSGAYEGAYSFASRFENGKGTNPEELIGAAHAGCFSMALSAALAEQGYSPKSVETHAEVNLDLSGDGPSIAEITLNTTASIPDIGDDDFQKIAEDAKNNCPVSKALAGPKIILKAKLK